MLSRSAYEVLGVDNDATEGDIRFAYRKLALKLHPDRNTDPAAVGQFREVQEAYEILSVEEKRIKYNLKNTDVGALQAVGKVDLAAIERIRAQLKQARICLYNDNFRTWCGKNTDLPSTLSTPDLADTTCRECVEIAAKQLRLQ